MRAAADRLWRAVAARGLVFLPVAALALVPYASLARFGPSPAPSVAPSATPAAGTSGPLWERQPAPGSVVAPSAIGPPTPLAAPSTSSATVGSTLASPPASPGGPASPAVSAPPPPLAFHRYPGSVSREQTASNTQLGCYGTGSDGPRVQAVYARPLGGPDQLAAATASIRQWAADVDATFDRSAQETGGHRHVRFVTDSGNSGCQLAVTEVVLSPAAIGNFTTMVAELVGQSAFDAADRKYLLWVDARKYCGIAGELADDSPSAANINDSGPGFARVDSGCWGVGEAHELMHALGAVQPSAPHATSGFHCTDGADAVCEADGSGGTQTAGCPTSNLALFDCQHDDYFSTAPAPGSYLATHWNTANSRFLAAEWTDSAPRSGAGLLNLLGGG